MDANKKSTGNIVNLNEDSKKHQHDDAGYKKLMNAKAQRDSQKASEKK